MTPINSEIYLKKLKNAKCLNHEDTCTFTNNPDFYFL